MSAIVRVSSRNLYQGGSSVIIMKGGHDQTKSRCGFYSKLGYCEGVVEEFGGEVGELGGETSPPVDETLAGHVSLLLFYSYRLSVCDAPIQLCSTI